MSDENYVDPAEWERWEAERLARNDQSAMRERDRRPKPPGRDDLKAQIAALQAHNAQLVAELETAREQLRVAGALAYELFNEVKAAPAEARRLRAA